MRYSALNVDAAAYKSHSLHTGDRTWLETNCYVDLWIEVPSSLSLDPAAALSFTVAADFEGDQWLFYKQSTSDLYDLYGIDVQELAIWRPVESHAAEQVARGRVPLVEVDAHFLPDTHGVTYRLGHAKTTIGIESIDVEARWLGYFHNGGYFTLEGEDYRSLFAFAPAAGEPLLPPYVEFAKFDRLRRLSTAELANRSLQHLRKHLERAPRDDPFQRFAPRLRADVDTLTAQGLEAFHQYAFVTLRQFGSCFELAGSYMRWLEAAGNAGHASIAERFETIASGARGLQMRTARAVALRKPFDAAPALQAMSEAWEAALGELRARYCD